MNSKLWLTGVSTLFVLTTLTACGGGGGSSGATADTTAPTVASTVPATDATDFAVSATVAVTFSEAMDCASLGSASFTLTDGAAVTGNVTCNGSTATFTPTAPLARGTQYTATVTSAATDAAGNALAANHVWSFTTIPKAWGTAAAIETNVAGVYAGSPQIAIDANANVVAVFTQWDGTRKNIMANRYSAATNTWGTAALIETDNAGDADFPQIAIDPNGDALAVWEQSDGTRNNIWANRYTTGTGWGTAALIETDNTGSANRPQIAIDANGNALAVWQQFDGTRTNVVANRYTAGTTNSWGTAVLIETDLGVTNAPQIAIDANGNGLAVWAQDAGTLTHIMANRYTAGTTNTWGTAASIASFNQGAGGQAQIAIDASGNAMAVWSQYDNPNFNIAANRYTVATNTWGTAQVIETDTFVTQNPQIAIDANGNALAVWVHLDGVYSIAANRYSVATNTWGTAALIETDNTGNAAVPQIAFDANGNALAVWVQGGGALQNIWANRYTAGAGWGAAALIETNSAGHAGRPQVAFDTNGNAQAVWDQSDGSASSDIWANRFD